ncbi:MAG: exodeoxyribonuclease VII large subunit, partial [Longimicrobiaceae bacterium]
LAGAGERAVRARRDRLAAAAGRLHALSPVGALARGFAIPSGPDGRILRGAREFEPGSRFTLTVADGSVPCRVEEGPATPVET